MSRFRQSAPEGERLLLRGLALGYPSGYRTPQHAHDWGQLVHAAEGVLEVQAGSSSWIVPPGRAVWVPPGVRHAVAASGPAALRTLYFPPSRAGGLPRRCGVLTVPPLLRELILHAIQLGPLEAGEPAHRRLAGVIHDQLAPLPDLPLELAWPRDPRARSVAEALGREPARPDALEELARGSGASARTLERLFRRETGLSFGRWRQQLRLQAAVRLLALGHPVTEVAFEVGYESPSAFIAMFRRALGTTPGRYRGTGRVAQKRPSIEPA